jgi:hypothetical protein
MANNRSVESTGNQLEEIVRSAHDNIRKLQQISLIPAHESNQNKTKSTPQMKSISKPRAMSGSHVRPSSAPKPSNQMNEINPSSSEYLQRKVDFVFKKVKEMEIQLNGIKITSKESQTLSNHLSEIIKMDKHSIVELREQVLGLKQKVERIGQQEQLLLQTQQRGKYSEVITTTTTNPSMSDVGILSEQIFQRVHKEFTKVVDEVVRACVNEQVEFMRKWSNKTSEDDDGEMRAQITSLKRRQNIFDERLTELKGSDYGHLLMRPLTFLLLSLSLPFSLSLSISLSRYQRPICGDSSTSERFHSLKLI